MATIIVSTQILDGNLGDGWTDNYDAARALANLTRETWESDLSEFTAAGHTVEIEIDVERNTSGCSRSVSVCVNGAEDGEAAFELEQAVENSLTDENRIWDEFCSNPPADVVGE